MKRIFTVLKPPGFVGLLQAICFGAFARKTVTENQVVTQSYIHLKLPDCVKDYSPILKQHMNMK